jgi:hypothetical protein
MSQTLPPHLIALINTGIILARHAHAVVAYAGDIDATAGDARPDRPSERRAPHRRGEDSCYRQGSEQARKRAKDARTEMGRGRAVIMRRCGIDGVSFRDAAQELDYNDEGIVMQQFQFACGDLLRVYREFMVAA